MTACVVCGSTAAQPFYGGLTRCERCHHVWADCDVTDEGLKALYRRNYFLGDEYADYVADRALIEKNFELRFRTLRRFLDPAVHRRLFEIGSAYGFFLNLARPYFQSVEGIDVTDEGVAYARETLRLDVTRGELLEQDFGDRRFDVVCLWDTIEHLRSPDLYIEKISAQMPSGSLIAVTTGDICSVNARIKRERWRMIHPPTHLHYFCPSTLARLLDRYGFDVTYSRHCGFHRSIGGMLNGVLKLRWGVAGRGEWMTRSALARRSIYLNLYDIIYVIAVKR